MLQFPQRYSFSPPAAVIAIPELTELAVPDNHLKCSAEGRAFQQQHGLPIIMIYSVLRYSGSRGPCQGSCAGYVHNTQHADQKNSA